jgi:putative ABC transport system permease protein
MISPRWMKVMRDIWSNRKRIVLAVLSIAVGVFAVGTISHMYLIVSSGLAKSYNSSSPADIVISTGDLFNQDLVDSIERMPEVKAAEGWRSLQYQFRLVGSDQWRPVEFNVAPDFNQIKVNKVFPEIYFDPDPQKWPQPGVWPPPTQKIVLERSSLLMNNLGLAPNAKQGDSIVLKLSSGKEREMTLAGLARDPGRAPATFSGLALGFITSSTAEWLGESRGYNDLRILTNASPRTLENISQIGRIIKEKVERSGHAVTIMVVNNPGEHPLNRLFVPLTLLMAVLGLLSLPLSGFLVINTISAFLAQQGRQIGVMKAIGATTSQISALYLFMVLFFGLLSLLVAVPLAALAANRFINFMAYFVNFNLGPFYIPMQVIALEFAVGLLVPLLAALHPVLKGAHMTVREAISNYGISQAGSKRDIVDRIVERVQAFPRPVLLSLRNTFRRKARLALTLATLVLASSIFIGVVSLQSSLNRTLDDVFKFNGFDVQITLKQSYRMQRLQDAISDLPEITYMEGWGVQGVSRIRPDGSETTEVMMVEAVPADSKLLHPTMRTGRWLLPEDENAVVVSPGFLAKEKDAAVGKQITLKIAGHTTTWKIVGVVNIMDSGQSILFANYSFFTHLMNQQGKASILLVGTTSHDGASQESTLKAVTARFEKLGIKINTGITLEQNRQQNAVLFNILILLLMAMALLLAVVGGLGLMGLMSINVIERTREIGVMRAIGASNRSILGIFMTEGLLVGVLSWLLGVIISIPMSKLISDAIGFGMFNGALSYSYSIFGAGIWLLLVLLISAGATYFPARDASRLTVRDVLAYE